MGLPGFKGSTCFSLRFVMAGLQTGHHRGHLDARPRKTPRTCRERVPGRHKTCSLRSRAPPARAGAPPPSAGLFLAPKGRKRRLRAKKMPNTCRERVSNGDETSPGAARGGAEEGRGPGAERRPGKRGRNPPRGGFRFPGPGRSGAPGPRPLAARPNGAIPAKGTPRASGFPVAGFALFLEPLAAQAKTTPRGGCLPQRRLSSESERYSLPSKGCFRVKTPLQCSKYAASVIGWPVRGNSAVRKPLSGHLQ